MKRETYCKIFIKKYALLGHALLRQGRNILKEKLKHREIPISWKRLVHGINQPTEPVILMISPIFNIAIVLYSTNISFSPMN